MNENERRKSRVRGAKQIKERPDWPYRIGEYAWIERLNFVRVELGDRATSILLNYSLSDPSYKSVRRLAAGQRIPDPPRYKAINRKFNELKRKLVELISVPEEIENLIINKEQFLDRYRSKINLFLRSIRPFVMRKKEQPDGLVPEIEHPDAELIEGKYIRTCNGRGYNHAPSKRAWVLILVHVERSAGTPPRTGGYTFTNDEEEKHTEIYLIKREDAPSLGLLRNAIDTWIDDLPHEFPNITFVVRGVWFSYA